MVDNKFVLGRSIEENEIWPNILEKAWAKYYGSYEIIEEGLVHLALSELTNGVPKLHMTAKEKNL